MLRFVDLTGKIFGRLTVIKQDGKNRWGKTNWLCLCECGQQTLVCTGDLNIGRTKSCGCLRLEKCDIANTIHGYSREKIYKIWAAIIQRCTNSKNTNYKNYGGRGITISKRWIKFENFLEDMGEAQKGFQLDRIKNSEGYCKENCHWVTSKQNNRNKRNNHLITCFNKTQCVAEWSEETGISAKVIYWRIDHGWLLRKILTTSVHQKRSK